jgi:transposase
VAFAYSLKEAVAAFYAMGDPEEAADFLRDIIELASRPSSPFELRALARTLKNWFEPIVAWHEARVSNGPTEGMNNLLKRVKRVAFGFTNFENFRIRALLYAGKPNFRVLDSIVVR